MSENDPFASGLSAREWRRFISAITSIPLFPAFRVKIVGEADPTERWDGSFPYHMPFPYSSIEWLEMDPVLRKPIGRLVADETTDRSADIERALRDAQIPFTIEAGIFRVGRRTLESQAPTN